MASPQDKDVIVSVVGKIGIIKLNRPKALNSFGGNLLIQAIDALRTLNEHPDTVFTVITGEGRFFSAGADIRAGSAGALGPFETEATAKVGYSKRLFSGVELVRSMIDHKKVLVLALNGPAVGGGAAWFLGSADIVFAADSTYAQVPFSALGLVPEQGSIRNLTQTMGAHRANDFLMFGRKLSAQELEQCGVVNRIFPAASFHKDVQKFLEQQLDVNDGKSMIITKKLQNAQLRPERIVALYDAFDALAERFVEGVPTQRITMKANELAKKSKSRL